MITNTKTAMFIPLRFVKTQPCDKKVGIIVQGSICKMNGTNPNNGEIFQTVQSYLDK